jgi:hypothetical protein
MAQRRALLRWLFGRYVAHYEQYQSAIGVPEWTSFVINSLRFRCDRETGDLVTSCVLIQPIHARFSMAGSGADEISERHGAIRRQESDGSVYLARFA